MKSILACLFLLCGHLWAAEFKAGISRAVITPQLPIWLSGYASRTNPATGVMHDLWAKALALQDESGGRAVIVTTDLIGLPRELSEEVARQVEKKHNLRRAQLLLSSSHTHSGPAVRPNLSVMFDWNADDTQRATHYSKKLTEDLVAVVGAALKNMAPARLFSGHGLATFAINRREQATSGVRIGLNPKGPVDHDVPVIKVAAPDGTLRAVLFGYACHNTTLGGDRYLINGDYAGFAQIELEKLHPEAAAMFVILSGGDQNPSPRGTVELAEQHGKSLAAAVDRVLAGELKPVGPPIRSAYQVVQLDFAPHQRAMFEEEAKGSHVFKQRRARLMLEAYDKGQPVRQAPYPVQAIRLNNDFTLLALGGEVVVDYALRVKREFAGENLMAAAYCNDVMCYIPSLRVLREGGYEVMDSMIYYGQPGPFAENVEETVFQAIHKVLRSVGAKPASP
jgi:hypothetical protein